jgi:hypothetical protein
VSVVPHRPTDVGARLAQADADERSPQRAFWLKEVASLERQQLHDVETALAGAAAAGHGGVHVQRPVRRGRSGTVAATASQRRP